MVIRFQGAVRTVNLLTFRSAVFFDFYEWRGLLCELSGAAARCFTHDACEERLWRELELAEPTAKPEPALLACRSGRYVDRHFLSQLIFALEPTREGCAMIFALSQIEIYCARKQQQQQHQADSAPPEPLHWLDIILPANGVKKDKADDPVVVMMMAMAAAPSAS